MRGDVYPHIEVPGWPAPLAGRALALELDPLAVGDAGGDPGLDRPGAHRPPAPGAHRAGIVDHQPAAPAGPARLGESEAARVSVPQMTLSRPAWARVSTSRRYLGSMPA